MAMQDEGESWQPDPTPPISGPNLDQGAIPTDESEGLNTAGSSPDESAGLNTSAPPNQPPGYGPLAGAVTSAQNNSPMVRKILHYIMGADGDPQMAAQATQQVKQQAPHLNDSDAALVALDQTAKTQGDEAAWKQLQGHRVSYNGKMAFAKVALDGTPQKPPNLNSAIDAANKASLDMPDGSHVQFAASQGGVTATVKMPGTSQLQQIPLTVEQFKQFVDVGGAGQWDKVQSKGMPGTLQALAQNKPGFATSLDQFETGPKAEPGQSQDQRQQTAADQFRKDHPAPDSEAVRTGRPIARDVTQGDQPAIPGTHDEHGKYLGPKNAPPATGYDPAIEARANEQFPYGDAATKGAYKDKQENEQLNRENAVEVATEKGKQATERARVTGQYGVQREQERSAGGVAKANVYSQARIQQVQAALARSIAAEEGRNNRSAEVLAAKALFHKVDTYGYDRLSDKEKAQYDQVESHVPKAAGAPQAPTPQALTPTGQASQPASGQAPQPGFVKGGYRFKGGNPASQASWEKVAG